MRWLLDSNVWIEADLVTRNVSDFQRISGLQVVNSATL